MKQTSSRKSDATSDRNFLRQLDNWELAQRAYEQSTPTELELVLAERLREADDALDDLRPED